MIDGITIKYEIKNFDNWRQLTGLKLYNNVDTKTGEIKIKKEPGYLKATMRGKFETFAVTIKEATYPSIGKKHYYLTVKGSLHKNQFNGTNYNAFSWGLLQTQIAYLCKSLSIDPKQAKISTLEIGVNICTPFPVLPFIKQNIIDYKGLYFNTYQADKRGRSIGVYCDLSEYQIKIYDKGLQNGLQENLLRFEKSFKKMAGLKKYRIAYLSDLQDFSKTNKLLDILLKHWKDVLVFDIEKELSTLKLKKGESELLVNGTNVKYWHQRKSADSENYDYLRKKFKRLVFKYGSKFHGAVNELLKKEWQCLFKNSPNLPLIESKPFTKKFPEFTIKVKGKFGENISKQDWETAIVNLEDFFNAITLPTEPIKLNNWTTIFDINLFVSSHMQVVKANVSNRYFLPYLERLIDFAVHLKNC